MPCVKYQFCTGCAHREDARGGELKCPADFNPFDELCPRHGLFMAFEEKKRPVSKKRFR